MANVISKETLNNVDELNKKLNKLQEYIYNFIKIDELPKKIDKVKENIKKLNNELNKFDLSSIGKSFEKLLSIIGEGLISEAILKNDGLLKGFDNLKKSMKQVVDEISISDLILGIVDGIDNGANSIRSKFDGLHNTISKIFEPFRTIKGLYNMDNDTIDSIVNKLWEFFEKIDNFKELCKHLGDDLYLIVQNIIPKSKEKISDSFGYFAIGIEDFLSKSWKNIQSIPSQISSFASAYELAYTGLEVQNATGLTKLGVSLGKFMSSTTVIYAGVIAGIAALGLALYQLFTTNEEFRNKVLIAWENFKEFLQTVYDSVIVPIFGGIKTLCMTVWEGGLQPLWEAWLEFVKVVSSAVLDLWNNISPILNTVLDILGPVFSAVFDTFGMSFGNAINIVLGVLKGFVDTAKVAFEGVRELFEGIIEFVSAVFTGDWKKAWEVVKDIFKNAFSSAFEFVSELINSFLSIFNSGGTLFDGIVDGIGNIFKSIVNALIDGLNRILGVPIDKINSIMNNIRKIEIFGMKPFSLLWTVNPITKVNIPKIDSFKNGGFVNPGQLFIANEPGNPELIGNIGGKSAVVNNTMILEGIQRAMRNAIIDGLKASGQGDVFVDVYVDGVFNERKLAQLNKKHYMKTGKPVYAR